MGNAILIKNPNIGSADISSIGDGSINGAISFIGNKIPKYRTNVIVLADAFQLQQTEGNYPSGYPYRATITDSEIVETDLIDLYPDQATTNLGILSCENDAIAGGVYIYASETPSTNLIFNTMIITPNGGNISSDRYSVLELATTEKDGLMSSGDKQALVTINSMIEGTIPVPQATHAVTATGANGLLSTGRASDLNVSDTASASPRVEYSLISTNTQNRPEQLIGPASHLLTFSWDDVNNLYSSQLMIPNYMNSGTTAGNYRGLMWRGQTAPGTYETWRTLKNRYYSMVGSDVASTSGWYKFLTIKYTNCYTNTSFLLGAYSTYAAPQAGIIYISARHQRDSSNNPFVLVQYGGWVVRKGFSVGDIIAVYSDDMYSIDFYIRRSVGQYGRIIVDCLSASNINQSEINIDLNSVVTWYPNNTSVISTQPTASWTATDMS